MQREIKELLSDVEKNGFAIGASIPIDGATAALFDNLKPVHPAQSLLHYMSVRRFESLITHKALYLRCLDLFQDQFEGKLPAANDSTISDFAAQFREQFSMAQRDIEAWKHFITVTLRKLTYVHCWFGSETEDLSMWRDYGDSGKGVCIRTTAKRLSHALTCPTHLGLELRRIAYTDEKEAIPEIVASLPVGRKQARPEFIREREVRLIATVTEEAWARGFNTPDGEPPDHQLIPVNLTALFDTVYLGQQASQEDNEKVECLANLATGRQVTSPSTILPSARTQT